MQIDIPFLYTTLKAFQLVKGYDDRSYIKVDDLFNYRKRLLEKALEDYEKNGNPELSEVDGWEGEIEFEEIDDGDALQEIISENPDLFTLVDGILYIDGSLSDDDIGRLATKLDVPYRRFDHYNKEIFNTLGIYKIFDDLKILEQYGHQLEREIEAAYTGDNFPSNLKQLLYRRFLLIFNTCLSHKTLVKNYGMVSGFDEEGIRIDENYDYFANSEYTKANEEYPIDRDVYENSDFYGDFMDNLNPIQGNIEDIYQYAIFGREPLYERCFDKNFTSVYMQAVFGTGEDRKDEDTLPEEADDFPKEFATDAKSYCFDFDIDEEEFAFYIIYVKKLEELIDEGHTEYTIIKNRLLYLLDNAQYSLFLPKNFAIQYEKATMYEADEDSFEFFADEAKYFIQDVFEGNAGKEMEKLLFTSTYYQLTQDEDVVEILSEYRDDSRYSSYAKIVLGDQLGYPKVKSDNKK